MPDPLLKKLQHRPDQPVLVLWPPDELTAALDRWEAEGVTVHRRMRGNSPFVLAFFLSCGEIDERAERVVSLLAGDDATLWLAYPKKSSKRYRTDVGRDDSWQPFGDRGFEPVRQIAIDDDWSAMRFRRTGQIKTMTRSRALSKEGKARLATRSPRSATDDRAIGDWIAQRSDARRPLVETLARIVREAAPDLEPSVSGKTLAFGPFHYRYASGREGDAHRISIADNAQYVSVYVLGRGESGGYLAEHHATKLGQVDVGKSCIRIKKLEHLDQAGLRDLVMAASAQHGDEDHS